MKQCRFPPDWDDERVKRALAYYEERGEVEAVAADKTALEDATQTVMVVPKEVVPAIRALIAKYRAA